MKLHDDLAPIILFTFNRPKHTKKALDSLKSNHLSRESHLIVYLDGPRNKEDEPKIQAVHKILENTTGFKSIEIIKAKQNKGLAESIITGVSSVLSKYNKCIVLEDDLVTSSYFLTYMNNALKMYEESNNVASIHGYVYPIKNLPETFFLRGADCWGWATWKRAWSSFEPNGKKLYNQLKVQKLEKTSNFDNSYNYSGMLKSQIAGKNNSWAIRWYYSAFLNNMITLYPGKSYIKNIGFGEEATHCSSNGDVFSGELNKSATFIQIDTLESKVARKKVTLYFRSIKVSFLLKLKTKLKSLL